ncbi:MAG TPA: glycosyltransferase family 4 protein [Desulfomonilaceae bacterium]|nr:glycosyltransferase family 4 protein [Desulfomonilaceae bacterium]
MSSITRKPNKLEWFSEPMFRIDSTPIVISNGLYFVWQMRPDLQKLFDLDTQEGASGFYGWWLLSGIRYYKGVPFKLKDEEVAYLQEPFDLIEQDCEQPITRLTYMIWCSSEELKSRFNLGSKVGRAGLLGWWVETGCKEIDTSCVPVKICTPTVHGDSENGKPRMSESPGPNQQPNPEGSYHGEGINIVGFAFGELGLGEDVRMASAAMTAARVPCCVYNAPIHLMSRAQDTRVMDLVGDEPFYGANIIFLPGVEAARLFLEKGPRLFKDRYNIGAWQWELPHWPSGLQSAYRLVDEIWASSRYTAESFRKSAPVEVLHMPMAVHIENIPKLKRNDFGLTNDSFIFIFFFDCLSSFARKNPIAVIDAFHMAFPAAEKEVKLVIKCMHANSGHDVWREILEQCQNDHRITAINETFSRERIIGLLNVSDALISLHRSEGFGRTMAEAMLLEKPVIATNYAGNTDFTNSNTAFLVDGPMKELGPDDYMFGTGQYWCDPDVEQAARHMRTCFEDRAIASALAKAGRAFILEHHNPATVGSAYRNRLEYLGIVSKTGE